MLDKLGGDDLIGREQALDFLWYRTFRRSLLRHSGVKLTRPPPNPWHRFGSRPSPASNPWI